MISLDGRADNLPSRGGPPCIGCPPGLSGTTGDTSATLPGRTSRRTGTVPPSPVGESGVPGCERCRSYARRTDQERVK